MAKIRNVEHYTNGKFRSFELDITYPLAWGKEGIEAKLASLTAEAVDAIRSGHNILIVTDRRMRRERVAIPALLALSAIHHHLIRKGYRTPSSQSGRCHGQGLRIYTLLREGAQVIGCWMTRRDRMVAP